MQTPEILPAIPETRAMIEDMLARCRAAMADCFTLDPDDYCLETRLLAYDTAQRFIKTSLTLASALDRKPVDFTHRIIVERIAHPAERAIAAPPPPTKKRKTIKSGQTRVRPQD